MTLFIYYKINFNEKMILWVWSLMNCRQYSKGINSLSIPIFLLLVVFPPNYLGSEPFNHQVILKNQVTTPSTFVPVDSYLFKSENLNKWRTGPQLKQFHANFKKNGRNTFTSPLGWKFSSGYRCSFHQTLKTLSRLDQPSERVVEAWRTNWTIDGGGAIDGRK